MCIANVPSTALNAGGACLTAGTTSRDAIATPQKSSLTALRRLMARFQRAEMGAAEHDVSRTPRAGASTERSRVPCAGCREVRFLLAPAREIAPSAGGKLSQMPQNAPPAKWSRVRQVEQRAPCQVGWLREERKPQGRKPRYVTTSAPAVKDYPGKAT